MPAELNRINALDSIESLKLQDAVAWARRLNLDRPPSWPPPPIDQRAIDRAGIQRLLEKERSDPDHPLNWHARAVAKEMSQPRARNMYFTMRRNLWTWPEFNTLPRNARRALEVVIELAREEAFPWYVSIAAETVMELAGFECSTFKSRRRDLECLAITRPARPCLLFNRKRNYTAGASGEICPSAVCSTPPLYDAATTDPARPYLLFNRKLNNADYRSGDNDNSPLVRAGALPRWPCAENHWGVDETQPLQDIPQWVIRYRHGTPFHKRRAAWWINYDLLCETQRVLPCFVVSPDTLPKTYLNRNRRMGAHATFDDDAGFAVMERGFAQQGPLPKSGFRAALWEGM